VSAPEFDALAGIDALYSELIENLNQHPEFVARFFLIRTHSSFRGAVRLCLSGQVAEAYMVLRGCLESALYGLYMAGDTRRQETWLRRHEDATSLARVKNEYSIRNLKLHLQSIDPRTHDITQRLYDQTIDYGGHPNERVISTQITTEAIGSRDQFTAEYFLCGEVSHRLCLKCAAQIGICCIDILFTVFRDRWRILGIDQRLDQIREGF